MTVFDVFRRAVLTNHHRGHAAQAGAWWTETEKCFDGPGTFFDCPQVDVWMQGGSDDAGFVQVIEGHTSDADRMRELMKQYADAVWVRQDQAVCDLVDGVPPIETAIGWSMPGLPSASGVRSP